ncbi:DUF6770 family protein [Flavobacterium sp.]|uniref:DUF6770 family protein n=1 Tax=Flavobacterium sp. TaxID=239 RepID=UPI002612E3B9|nr:DUF6770 family protein [Flavobacterium sp.]
MKKIVMLCLLAINVYSFAQTAKLSALSANKFLASEIVYDDNGYDVYGYFLLYDAGDESKGVYRYEYVLLDKNLNKMASGDFSQERVDSISLMADYVTTKPLYVTKKGEVLYFNFPDTIKGDEIMYSLRTLSLKDFKVSEPTYIRNNSPVKQNVGRFKRKDMEAFQYLVPTKNGGFLVYDETLMDASMRIFMGRGVAKTIKSFRFLDMDLKEKWRFEYDHTDENSYYDYYYLNGDGNDMVFVKSQFQKSGNKRKTHEYEVIDAQTGIKKFSLSSSDPQNLLRFKRWIFEDHKIVTYAAITTLNDKDVFLDKEVMGYVKIMFDRKTGKELGRDYFRWTDLSDKFPIDAFGKIKDYGFIQFLDFNRTTDGKTIVIGEGYSKERNSIIKDLFVFVFDDQMKLADYHKVEKHQNDGPISAHGGYLQQIGAFDYMYSQKLPGGGNVFYYMDNENKSVRKPSWVLGVITYAENKFDFQKVTLTTQKGQIYPLKAKNGYILLREDTDKDSELRLEKINY